jgi:ABC-type methionine transport system ATPase subunit
MTRSAKPTARPEASAREKFYLTYPPQLLTEPLLYWVGQKFKVITNIRGASISHEMGLVAVELEGVRAEIDRAITWLRSRGVQVEPIEKNVIE